MVITVGTIILEPTPLKYLVDRFSPVSGWEN
jgi:hypothetical protein